MGETGTGEADGTDSWYDNPAALRFMQRREVVLSQTQLLGDSSLPFGAVAAGIPTFGRGAFGFSLTQFGNSFYREREIVVAHAFAPAPSMAVGAAVTGSFLDVARYGGASVWSVDAGVLARPNPYVSLGFAVKRLNNPGLPGAREGLPSITRAGIALTPLRRTAVTVDLVKSRERPFDNRFGCEAALAAGFFLRVGVESRPARYSLGMGVRSSFGRIDYAFLTHPFLGDQHHVSLSFDWGNPRFP
jgi:hypothetical protein